MQHKSSKNGEFCEMQPVFVKTDSQKCEGLLCKSQSPELMKKNGERSIQKDGRAEDVPSQALNAVSIDEKEMKPKLRSSQGPILNPTYEEI